MIQGIFTAVLHMSIIASIAAVLIIVLRFTIGRRLPKLFCYVLWFFVLIRLIIPFSLSSTLSIFNIVSIPKTIANQNIQYIGNNINMYQSKNSKGLLQENSKIQKTNDENVNSPQAINFKTVSKAPVSSVYTFSWIWAAGLLCLLLFSILSYLNTWKKLRTAIIYNRDNLTQECCDKLNLKRKIGTYTTDMLFTPVVHGVIKPTIILPVSIAEKSKESELRYIISHELVHIKRFDYVIKLLWILALCIHWFNPVIWIVFIMFQKDMEMSCDEKVMCLYNYDIRSEYAISLINLAAEQNLLLNSSMLAFGESNIKGRVKGIMNFKKPGFWIVFASFVILVVMGSLVLTNGQNKKNDKVILASAASNQNEKPSVNGKTKGAVDRVINMNVISPSVSKEMKEKLMHSIEDMKKMNSGVDSWQIIYSNGERVIIYNYAHIVGVDISEKNNGIYSIIELKNLKIGNYQGSELAVVYPSPDCLACVMGTNLAEMDSKITDSLYVCNLIDSSVNEIKTNYNMAHNKVTWYRNMISSTMLPWYALIEGPDKKIIWSIEKSKELSALPQAAMEEAVDNKSVENINFNTGYYPYNWWKIDDNTVIGSPYKKEAANSAELKLSDFEIIEVNLNNKEIRTLYKIN